MSTSVWTLEYVESTFLTVIMSSSLGVCVPKVVLQVLVSNSVQKGHTSLLEEYVSERKTGKRWRGLSTWQAVWLYLIQDSERIHHPLIRSVCASWQKASKKVMWFCHVASGAHNSPCACTYTCK